ncbi:putative Type I protein exporter [Helianthus annuus]|uniref:Type I protein exporter n=1 Tax=Helianthus annuus TaxID=4232 RepID=A0A9K3DWD1_HELAN|nr:putative Type I protein exporter [Helianthus annuus]KAF5762751.1 putative Type I protein exporter [Helianthus annuus]KAJ0471475.1 putative ABC transporter, P-loop containing nucleoside triphosphate hydrolase [Helianthus annuus]
MFETINRKPEIDAYDTKGKVLDDIRGDIELKDVYFTYPARPDEEIFSGFSLCISSGTTAALVGQSGSGKSTVISLIERFYDPQQGEILIDNINLKEFQIKWIREKIGLVSQEPVLFTSSIKDNILYGKDDASMDEIRVAVELANAAKFIDKLPKVSNLLKHLICLLCFLCNISCLGFFFFLELITFFVPCGLSKITISVY